MPATIGVASGAEAMKTINNYNLAKNNTTMTEPSTSASSFSSIKNSIFSLNNNKSTGSTSSNKNEEASSNGEQQDERRPSITRIIRSDSFQNTKSNAPIAQRPASNSVTSSTNTSTRYFIFLKLIKIYILD